MPFPTVATSSKVMFSNIFYVLLTFNPWENVHASVESKLQPINVGKSFSRKSLCVTLFKRQQPLPLPSLTGGGGKGAINVNSEHNITFKTSTFPIYLHRKQKGSSRLFLIVLKLLLQDAICKAVSMDIICLCRKPVGCGRNTESQIHLQSRGLLPGLVKPPSFSLINLTSCARVSQGLSQG